MLGNQKIRIVRRPRQPFGLQRGIDRFNNLIDHKAIHAGRLGYRQPIKTLKACKIDLFIVVVADIVNRCTTDHQSDKSQNG